MYRAFQLFLILISAVAFGQDFELGKVSVAELQQVNYPQDTSAAAAVIFNKAKTNFKYTLDKGFVCYTEFDIRIKIYKKEGLKYANFDVPYYVGWEEINPDFVEFSRAVTYNLVNGKTEKTKLDNQGAFKESINKYWKQKTITMPNVKVGSVIEFRYTHRSENIVRLQDFKFQYNIPVQYSEYTTEIPEVYIYNEVIRGFLNVETTRKNEPASQSFTNKYGISDQLRYNQIRTVHKIQNVPALKGESFVNNIETYRCTLEQELQRIRYENQPDKKFAQTWEDVATDIYKHDDFGKQLILKEYFEAEVGPITAKLATPEEKLEAIFRFVKLKVKWDGTYGAYTKKGVKKAWLERTGNIAEINFILIAMLNYSGIITNPVVLSTISNGISLFPNRTAFNYVVAAAEIEGKRYLLDASAEYLDKNILPFHALNWNGRIIQSNGKSEEIELLPTALSRSSNNLSFAINENASVTGKVKIHQSDYLAFRHRQSYTNVNKDSYLEKLENDYGKIAIEAYEVENQNDLKKPVVESFGFTSQNSVEIIGDKMYFSPMLFFTTVTNPFRSEKREYPIEFGFPTEHKYNISVEIPGGYSVESIPAPINLGTEGKIASFKYNILSNGNKIQLAVTFSVNAAVVSPGYYPAVKDFFQKMIDKQNEKIVLKKG